MSAGRYPPRPKAVGSAVARVFRVLRRVLETSRAIASAALAVLLDATGDGMAAATADIVAASMRVVVAGKARKCD